VRLKGLKEEKGVEEAKEKKADLAQRPPSAKRPREEEKG
jgi:hypothetical protein